jgi:hypothetical protein
LFAVLTVNFRPEFELLSEKIINAGNAAPPAREALLFITIAGLMGFT